MFKHEERPATKLSLGAQEFINQSGNSEYSVLCGRNNCGKSYLLKLLVERHGERASYLGPARYQNFNMLAAIGPSPANKRSERWKQWMRQWQLATQNIDSSPFNLQQAIAELSNTQREQLSEIMDLLLGAKMDILYTIENNSMSQQYVSVKGHNLSFTSSGYRLIASLTTSLLNQENDVYLIDEPELGVSPEAQGVFSEFLFSKEHRKKYFPHISVLVLATHSTVFIDRKNIGNNYFVEKQGDVVDVQQVQSLADINRIHFFLLGNRLESLYMPSAIVIVEGKCDHQFVERTLALRFPQARVSVISANTDNRIRDVFNVTKGLLGDIQKSPYRDRVFAIIDSKHGTGLVQHLESMGMPKANIIVWPKNGIEYYYPPSVVAQIFGCDTPIQIDADRVTAGGITYTKNELLELVLARTKTDTAHAEEFQSEFLDKIRPLVS